MPGLYIPKPSVPFVNPKTGLVSDEWYRTLLDLNTSLATVAAVIGGLSFTDISGVLGLPQLVAHEATHRLGGADALKLDDLAAPNDNTDLDATALAHGLLPKLSGNAGHRLNGLGQWV